MFQEVLLRKILFASALCLSLFLISSSQTAQCPYTDMCYAVKCPPGKYCRQNPTDCTYRCAHLRCKPWKRCNPTICSRWNTCDNKEDCVADCYGCEISCKISRLNHTYPKNPRIITQDYRKITFGWDELENFSNISGDIKNHTYTFHFSIDSPAQYKIAVHRNKKTFTRDEPVLTLDNLLIGTKIGVRVGLTEKIVSPYFSFAPDKIFETKSIEDVRRIEIPGKVVDIKVNPIGEGHTEQSIEWKTPENIMNSENELETSIQYEIKQCNYHPLLKNVTDCKVIGEVVANPSNRIQSTLQSKESIFPVTPKLPTNRDVVIKITPIALNSERGPSEMTTVRLDPLSVPQPPTGIELMQSTNNSITLSWDEHDPTDRSVKYLVTFTGSKISNNITPNNNITLVDLDKSRTYRVKVAVSHSQNGTGLFSPEIKFAATRNGTWTIQEVNYEDEIPSSSSTFESSVRMVILLNTISIFMVILK